MMINIRQLDFDSNRFDSIGNQSYSFKFFFKRGFFFNFFSFLIKCQKIRFDFVFSNLGYYFSFNSDAIQFDSIQFLVVVVV